MRSQTHVECMGSEIVHSVLIHNRKVFRTAITITLSLNVNNLRNHQLDQLYTTNLGLQSRLGTLVYISRPAIWS